MNKIAAIDIDATVVDSPFYWYKWLELMTKAGYKYSEVSQNYDFSKTYGDIWKRKGIAGSPLDFWRSKHVYRDMEPMSGAVEALEFLKSEGYMIVFVSALKGDHHYSKYRFIEEYFPFMDGFVGTKEKWAVNADLVVDDRHKFLNMFSNPLVDKYKMVTTFDQDEELTVKTIDVNSWVDFVVKYKEKQCQSLVLQG